MRMRLMRVTGVVLLISPSAITRVVLCGACCTRQAGHIRTHTLAATQRRVSTDHSERGNEKMKRTVIVTEHDDIA